LPSTSLWLFDYISPSSGPSLGVLAALDMGLANCLFHLDGSITFNLVSGTTLQTIHFHDEESRSISQLSPKNRSASGIASWGGEGTPSYISLLFMSDTAPSRLTSALEILLPHPSIIFTT
jgi:hypothetical protein